MTLTTNDAACAHLKGFPWRRTRRIYAAIAGMLIGASGIAAANHAPGHEGEPLTPEHVGAESRMTQLLTEARALAARKEFPLAIQNYIYAFNYSRGAVRLALARLSVVPAEIAALGGEFPPARDALRAEVRIRAGLILTNVAGTDEILEFIALNRALDEPQRVLEMYDQLKSMGERARDMSLRMRALIDQELLEAERYTELGERLIAMARSVIDGLAELDSSADFDAAPDAIHASYASARREFLVANGIRVTDALFRTRRVEHGQKLARRLIDVTRSAGVVKSVAEAAQRNQLSTIAAGLIDYAGNVLPAAEREALKQQQPDAPK